MVSCLHFLVSSLTLGVLVCAVVSCSRLVVRVSYSDHSFKLTIDMSHPNELVTPLIRAGKHILANKTKKNLAFTSEI